MTLTDDAPELTDLTNGDALFRRDYPFVCYPDRRRLEFAARRIELSEWTT